MAKDKTPEQKHEPETPAQEQAQEQATEGGNSQGIRVRRALQMKQLLPELDWINKNVIAVGTGHKVIIGRVYGLVTGTEEKLGQLPNGEASVSFVLKGVFESEAYLTGELSDFGAVFFPSAFSEKLHNMFKADEHLKTVEIDCDVGLEATGKTIPYTWVIVQHVEGQAFEPLKRLRSSRAKPSNAVARLPAPAAPKTLAGPA